MCRVAADYLFVVIPPGTFLGVFYAAVISELARVLLQHHIIHVPGPWQILLFLLGLVSHPLFSNTTLSDLTYDKSSHTHVLSD